MKGGQVADYANVLVRRAKKLVVVGFGSLAVTAALVSFGAGSASADEIAPDPGTPLGGPQSDVRPSGWQEYDATTNIIITEGDDGLEASINSGDGISSSDIAVPATDVSPPEPGDISECIIDYAGC